jgi:hypothetical protein
MNSFPQDPYLNWRIHMGALLDFAKERAGSLISKKVGAAVAGESFVAAANPELVGVPMMVYIVAQAVLEGFKHWADNA